jgi:hypothetical protein
MTYYRLYHLNRCSGHIERVEEIEAADDVEAVSIARDCERGAGVELWQEGRKVLRLEGPSDRFVPAKPDVSQDAVAG